MKPKIDKNTHEHDKSKYISLLVTNAKRHTLDRAATAYIEDIKNMLHT
jgi:hypothetical protein